MFFSFVECVLTMRVKGGNKSGADAKAGAPG